MELYGPERDQRILAAYDAGESITKIAAREGVSRPRISQLLRRARKDRMESGAQTSMHALAGAMHEIHVCYTWGQLSPKDHEMAHRKDAEAAIVLLARRGFEITKRTGAHDTTKRGT
jgi:hypothetical protein